MNQSTSKLLANYARDSGRTKKDIKDWWKSLVDADKDRARKKMTVVVEERRKDRKNKAEQSALKKK